MFTMYDYKEMFSPNEILIYLRKSRSDDPTLSVEDVLQKHETILNEWAEKNLGTIIPEENKYREVVSGETIDDRPEVQKLLKRVESPKIKAILIVEVQRLSRGDLEDAGRLIKLLRYTNTFIITPTKTYDLQDEYDRDIFERELKRGNEFLEYQKKIMNRGRLLSVSQGNYLGSIPPYGYDKTWVMDGKKKCPTLKPNKEQADVILMAFQLYVTKNWGYQRVCNHLDSLGFKPPIGEHWSAAALKDMLANVHYIGKVRWNWRKTQTIVEDSEIVKTRPKAKMGDYLIYDGKHPGIIPEKLFEEAQKKSGKNHRAKATTKVRNPLASILYCHCGRAMKLNYHMNNGIETQPPRLICPDQHHCKTGSCAYSDIIERVKRILEQNIEDFEIKLKNRTKDSVIAHEQLIKNLKKKLKALQEKEILQWEAQSDPDPNNRMPKEIFQQLNAKLLKEKEEIQQAIENTYNVMPEPIDYKEKIIHFQKALDALNNPEIDNETKNELLKTCIQRITYYREAPTREKGGKKEKGAWSNPPIILEINQNI